MLIFALWGTHFCLNYLNLWFESRTGLNFGRLLISKLDCIWLQFNQTRSFGLLDNFWGIRKVGLISFCLLLYVSSHCSYVPLRRQDVHSELPFKGLDLLIEELFGHIPSIVVLPIRLVNYVFDFKNWTRLLLSLQNDIYSNTPSLDVHRLDWCKSRHTFSFRDKV